MAWQNIISKKAYDKRLEAKKHNSNVLVSVCGENEIDVLVYKNDSPKIEACFENARHP
jgi:hypothetical protein